MKIDKIFILGAILIGLAIIFYVFIDRQKPISSRDSYQELSELERKESIPHVIDDEETEEEYEYSQDSQYGLGDEELGVYLDTDQKSLRTPTPTPYPLQAIYMTSWVAGTPSLREPIIELIDQTDLNAIVIDIKDDTGKISFRVHDEILASYGSSENRIPNIDDLLARLRDKGIYIIGRISVFQDPFLAEARPDLAVRTVSTNDIWRDRKGLSFLHPDREEVWEYTLRIAKEAFDRGFDEINFDYVRFPSDGPIGDIYYELDPDTTRADSMRSFFQFLHKELADHPLITSVDLFGMTTTHNDDLGIGQLWHDAAPYFDYIAPMIYPSHYPPTWMGISHPASEPYRVVAYALQGAIEKQRELGLEISAIRAWIQDFNHGAVYTPEMVLEQIRAARNTGVYSWMVWNPSNRYRLQIYQEI